MKNISLIYLGIIDEKVKFYLTIFLLKMKYKNDITIFLNNLVLDLSINFQENDKNLEIIFFHFQKKRQN